MAFSPGVLIRNVVVDIGFDGGAGLDGKKALMAKSPADVSGSRWSRKSRQEVVAAPRPQRLVVEPVRHATVDIAQAMFHAVMFARSAGILVENRLPAGLVVKGDGAKISQVITGLLTNLRNHAPTASAILRATSDDQQIVICLDDDGPGIPVAKRELIFQAGWKAADSTGDGHGLSVGRGLMRAMNGDLTVTESPQGGASFRMVFPQVGASIPASPIATVLRRS